MSNLRGCGLKPAAAVKWLALIGLNLATGLAFAQGIPLSPQQVVSNALAHSFALKIAGKEIEAAQAKKAEAGAQALPHLSAEVRASRYTGLQDSAFGPFFLIPAIENRYGAGIGVTQPAYTGGRLKNQKEGATYQEKAARATHRGAVADLTLQALTAYWNWSKVFYSVQSLEAAVARMEAHAQDMQNLHQAGLATDNDTLATDVLLDQTRLRLEEALRAVDLAGARLTFLTGQRLTTNSIPEAAASLPPGALSEETQLLATAKTNRAERVAGEYEVRASEAQVKATRADWYPQVSLLARYEQARPNLLNIPPADRWQDDGFAGIALTWSIFDWGLTRAKVRQANARRAQAKLRLSQLEDQIALEVREARISLQNARSRLLVAERTQRSAERNLAAATDLWRNGLARHAEVLDAHAQLTNAQSEVIAAKADLRLAHTALDHATGILGARPGEQ